MRPSTRQGRYVRKSFYVDPKAIEQARIALGARSDAEAVRLAIDRAVETETFWRFMVETRASLKPGSIEEP